MILNPEGKAIGSYADHAVSGDMVQQYLRKHGCTKRRLSSLPVCPKCERTGMRDKGWTEHKTMCCPHCGYRGKATHVLSAYLDEGLYK